MGKPHARHHSQTPIFIFGGAGGPLNDIADRCAVNDDPHRMRAEQADHSEAEQAGILGREGFARNGCPKRGKPLFQSNIVYEVIPCSLSLSATDACQL